MQVDNDQEASEDLSAVEWMIIFYVFCFDQRKENELSSFWVTLMKDDGFCLDQRRRVADLFTPS